MSGYVYRKGLSTGPAMRLAWYDYTNTLYQFATGWTFSAVTVAKSTTVTLVTKTTAITGANTSPNIVIDWATADFTALTANTIYQVILTATPTAGDPITFENLPEFTLLAAPA